MSGTKQLQSSFDRAVADGFVDASRKLEGLPGYLGVVFVDFQPGRLRAEMEVRPELLTPFGNMHGGVLAALCDHVLGCVCYPHMTRGQWAATTEFKLNYLAPVSKGQVVVEAEIIAMTRATAVVRIEARNGDRLACIAQGTVLIRDPKE
jgi:1,4-dihydroxy-2-naphthoyl-CoA hydrolase